MNQEQPNKDAQALQEQQLNQQLNQQLQEVNQEIANLIEDVMNMIEENPLRAKPQ